MWEWEPVPREENNGSCLALHVGTIGEGSPSIVVSLFIFEIHRLSPGGRRQPDRGWRSIEIPPFLSPPRSFACRFVFFYSLLIIFPPFFVETPPDQYAPSSSGLFKASLNFSLPSISISGCRAQALPSLYAKHRQCFPPSSPEPGEIPLPPPGYQECTVSTVFCSFFRVVFRDPPLAPPVHQVQVLAPPSPRPRCPVPFQSPVKFLSLFFFEFRHASPLRSYSRKSE